MRTARNLLLAVALLAVASCLSPAHRSDDAQSAHVGVFVSTTGEILRAAYNDNDTVTLTLPDGSTDVLPIAVSGSGARYAADNREWWEHQGEGTYSVDDQPVFRGTLER